ncbi:MAG TPA: hypothetical protein VHA11_06975 [Bryobacteraceae bacterium]|nr:hypothetical protein [Bryobacteraceae bacterium]
MPRRSRIAGHIRLLGILWVAISAFRVLPGLFLTLVFQNGFPFHGGEDVPDFVPILLHTIGSALLIGGALGILVGVGLLQRKSWARMGALLLGGVSLIDMPFGTALGIYTLWVLLPAESEQEYQRIAENQLAPAGR